MLEYKLNSHYMFKRLGIRKNNCSRVNDIAVIKRIFKVYSVPIYCTHDYSNVFVFKTNLTRKISEKLCWKTI